jgi:hypothetical protein
LVQVWKFDSKAQLHSVFSVQLDMTVPKAVAFAGDGSKDVYVFGVFDGNLYVLPSLLQRIDDDAAFKTRVAGHRWQSAIHSGGRHTDVSRVH